ncbi:hypothetical protein AD94_04176, partial [Klebsiella variicola]
SAALNPGHLLSKLPGISGLDAFLQREMLG